MPDIPGSAAASLRLVQPRDGARFQSGQDVLLQAVAVDPDGEIRTVEFFAGDRRIGVSQILTRDVEIPGRPRTHEYPWENPPAGTHILQARAVSRAGIAVVSAGVRISVLGDPRVPVVWVDVTPPTAVREGPLTPGGAPRELGFSIRRSGDGERDLPVFFHFEGDAEPGRDFEVPGGPVMIPAGQSHAEVRLAVLDDLLSEGPESVVLALDPSPTMGPVESYQVDPLRGRARALIEDDEPQFVFEAPELGRDHPLGSPILIRIVATWREGYVPHVEFLANGRKIGESVVNFIQAPPPGSPIGHEFIWTDAPRGDHPITVRAPLPDGTLVVTERSRLIRVGGEWIPPLVTIAPGKNPAFEHGDLKSRHGSFVLNRSGGSVDLPPLTVYLTVGGTATPGVDYQWNHPIPQDADAAPGANLPHPDFLKVATFPAGESETTVSFTAEADDLVEGVELVRLELVQPPFMPLIWPWTGAYQIGAPGVASVAILDADAASLVVLSPVEGARIPTGVPVSIETIGMDPKSVVGTVEFFANGQKIGESCQVCLLDAFVPPGTPVFNSLSWTPSAPGRYDLEAVGWFGADLAVTSPPVTVHAGPTEAAIEWILPADGDRFLRGHPIPLHVQAVDPAGALIHVEFFAGRQRIGESVFSCPECRLAPGVVLDHRMTWDGAPAGRHELRAFAVRADGVRVVSAPRSIVVTPEDPPVSFVRRILPERHGAGRPLVVRLEVNPAATTSAHVVEEQPPFTRPMPGRPDLPAPFWEVRAISHGGVVDPRTGRLKFGPFFDAAPRSLTYELVPNFVVDAAPFDGVGVADGVESPIRGDQVLRSVVTHPADDAPEDYVLTASELTAYAAAWKRGQPWPAGPQPIPMDYVTRVAALWQGGERYRYDPGAGAPPLCWVLAPTGWADGEGAATPPGFTGTCLRSGQLLDDGSVRVRVRVIPAPGTRAFAVEEHLAAEAVVSNVSDDGVFEASQRILRWGPTTGGGAITWEYTLRGPGGADTVRGMASFDGQSVPVRKRDPATNGEGTPRLIGVDPLPDGSHQICLELPEVSEGVVHELQVSSDLRHWTPVGRYPSGAEAVFARDAVSDDGDVRFYQAVEIR
ncbi:MAG: hypothetical protein KF791_14970 [Verrucomicrobiae bacterium]|nr:hypothetical protein [Verrucomicrobiae bacterium]